MQENPDNFYRILNNITGILVKLGVSHAVLCPGSRSAPLALSILRNGNIKSFIINDERSAGYIALGIAQQTRKTVALVSTSGTAAVNFAPAVAEAFFQEIPLLVLTADRPVETIGQNENQAIFQKNLYSPNVLKSFQFNILYNDYESEQAAYRIVSEAINTSLYPQMGPVHINVPLREPLYLVQKFKFMDEGKKIIELVNIEHTIQSETQKQLVKELSSFNKIMIVAGLYPPARKLERNLNKFLSFTDVVFIPDIISNLNGIERSIKHQEVIIKKMTDQQIDELKPDLLITFGGQIVSNIFKSYIRGVAPKDHWHIDFSGRTIDSFSTLTKILPIDPEYFFKLLLKNIGYFKTKTYQGYFKKWESLDIQAKQQIINSLSDINKAELFYVGKIVSHLPKNSMVQLGNSLPVRYFNNLRNTDNPHYKTITFFSNRGTSGIDGSLSTAVGSALTTGRVVTLVSGDLSFFYDRNGLWNNYIPPNLKVIVLNNHGGQIFGKIPGCKDQPELNDYFITHQLLNIKETVNQHKLNYLYCNHPDQVAKCLSDLYSLNDKTTVLEFDILPA